jgi:hypothetical protein
MSFFWTVSLAEKRKRWPTHNEKVRARDAAERHIKFKQDGTPTGPSKSEFANTVAYLGAGCRGVKIDTVGASSSKLNAPTPKKLYYIYIYIHLLCYI